jgi:hypothetical protein
MGYLSNNGTITVDAVLTKKGRELLAKGQGNFNITQFALSDDEIDYDLWNPQHGLGSDYFGVVIENMPITEAVPDETQSMKYKLITLPAGTRAIPYIAEVNNLTSVDIFGNNISTTSATLPNKTVAISTYQFNGTTGNVSLTDEQTYTITLLDQTYVTLTGLNTSRRGSESGNSITYSQVADTVDAKTGQRSMSFVVQGNTISKSSTITTPIVKTTKLIITNEKFGSRLVLPVTFTY